MKSIRRVVYPMSQYIENVKEGYISNDADTQRNPAWKAIVDGLAVTILTDDYVPEIILAEEDNGQIKIVDGGSRTAAFRMIRYGNYKIKSSVENSVIKYKRMTKDSEGRCVWEEAEFDIRNKTFEQFPKDLQKKFDEYQLNTVIHEHCDKEKTAMYMKRYNERKNFSASQKQFLYLPKFAEHVRTIAKKQFFINDCVVKQPDKDNGVIERIISESVMIMFHFDKWNKNGKKLAIYLNDNATEDQFKKLDNYISRLEKVVDEKTKDLFTTKDSFVWFTLFDKFTQTGLDDKKFGDFLTAFANGLRNKAIDGKLFDTVDTNGSTKDKAVIAAKLHILETLMIEYLHIDTTKTENNDIDKETLLDFVKDNVKSDATDEDIDFYTDLVEDCVRIDDPIYEKCRLALIALMGYACQKDKDKEFEIWIKDYKNKSDFSSSQKVNYSYMKNSFDKAVNL